MSIKHDQPGVKIGLQDDTHRETLTMTSSNIRETQRGRCREEWDRRNEPRTLFLLPSGLLLMPSHIKQRQYLYVALASARQIGMIRGDQCRDRDSLPSSDMHNQWKSWHRFLSGECRVAQHLGLFITRPVCWGHLAPSRSDHAAHPQGL